MLRSTIHLTTCRGRRILVIYYVKKGNPPPPALSAVATGDFPLFMSFVLFIF